MLKFSVRIGTTVGARPRTMVGARVRDASDSVRIRTRYG